MPLYGAFSTLKQYFRLIYLIGLPKHNRVVGDKSKGGSSMVDEREGSSVTPDFDLGDKSKQFVLSLVGAGVPRADIMTRAELEGVTWERSDNAMSDWSGFLMALKPKAKGVSKLMGGENIKVSSWREDDGVPVELSELLFSGKGAESEFMRIVRTHFPNSKEIARGISEANIGYRSWKPVSEADDVVNLSVSNYRGHRMIVRVELS